MTCKCVNCKCKNKKNTEEVNEENVDITKIKEIELPNKPIKEMSLEEAREWHSKLYPYYFNRSEILQAFGIKEWEKVMLWIHFNMRVTELEKMNNN